MKEWRNGGRKEGREGRKEGRKFADFNFQKCCALLKIKL